MFMFIVMVFLIWLCLVIGLMMCLVLIVVIMWFICSCVIVGFYVILMKCVL